MIKLSPLVVRFIIVAAYVDIYILVYITPAIIPSTCSAASSPVVVRGTSYHLNKLVEDLLLNLTKFISIFAMAHIVVRQPP